METILSDETRRNLLSVTALASEYCNILENAREAEKEDFVATVLPYLPRLYSAFYELDVPESSDFESGYACFTEYVDEDYYESIRRHVETLLGPDDVFLETFEEDMKYSDTPIAASISESLADIFQPLYNFISVVRDTDGEQIAEAYRECKENFEAYWAQTLCNVMRPLNHLRCNPSPTE